MQKFTIKTEEEFVFEAGGRLDSIEIAYHTSGHTYTKGEKVLWICHALTANSDAEDWWPQLVGPGKLFDTDKYFIVCVNMLGSPYGSSGPSSINPDTGKPFFFDFPKVTVRDMIKASIIVRRHLGIDQVDLLVGSSIGGFQAIEWAVMEPDVFKRAIFIATASRETPWLGAGAEAQRMALEADPTFRACESLEGGREGLKCARAQALITYRSAEGYNRTQFETDPDTLFSSRVASYERYQGEKLVKRFDAYSYWYLAWSLDSHNVGRKRGGVDAALGTIKALTDVVAVDSDGLFPPKEMEDIAKAIPGAKFHVISSAFGHDGFLLETEQLTEIIKPLL
ncbi:MAG: homoserine O-acetyltransferase [Bacteroidales bacterium]|nr:homoserine O-acetyltransferase [Candidatus Cryptobacteroides onthequi]